MTAINDNDISNAELLEAINNGFTRMQEQFDQRFQEHATDNEQEFAQVHSEIGALSKKLDETVKVTDTHDQMLQTFRR